MIINKDRYLQHSNSSERSGQSDSPLQSNARSIQSPVLQRNCDRRQVRFSEWKKRIEKENREKPTGKEEKLFSSQEYQIKTKKKEKKKLRNEKKHHWHTHKHITPLTFSVWWWWWRLVSEKHLARLDLAMEKKKTERKKIAKLFIKQTMMNVRETNWLWNGKKKFQIKVKLLPNQFCKWNAKKTKTFSSDFDSLIINELYAWWCEKKAN